MTKSISTLSLVAVAVLCAMPTGYRRAGFSLEQGKNSLDVNQEQFESLRADNNLTVILNDADDIALNAESAKSTEFLLEQYELVTAENTVLRNKVADLTALLAIQEDDIKELDISSAPKDLHHYIALIDDLNKVSTLTQKPNCDHLTMTVDGEKITPTAAERDAAWAWYQTNVVVIPGDTKPEAKG